MKLPKENRPDWTTNIQWKGTDLCMDFWCPECGNYSHFDGFFAYAVRCSSCASVFAMPTHIPVTKIEEPTDLPILIAKEDDEEEDGFTPSPTGR